MEKNVKKSEVLRKRGRPAGKNRVPLSMDERRARNAQYERERREGMSGALADLAEAAGCDGSISSAELLATVIAQLQQAMQVENTGDLAALRRSNENLMAQIEMLEQRLGDDDSDDGCSARTQGEIMKTSRPAKRKRENDESPVVAPLPKRSPPEDTSPVMSSKLKYSPAARIPVQQFPGPSSSEYDSRERCRFPESTSTEEHEIIYPGTNYALNRDSLPVEPWLPVAAMQHFLPVPKISPASNASDQPEHEVDCACQFQTSTSHHVWPTPQPQDLDPGTYHSLPSSQPCLSAPFLSGSQHLVEAMKRSPNFKHEFLPADPWHPNVAMSTENFLPEPMTSPVSHTPELQEHNFDYSSYLFAGLQVPTPECQLESTFEAAERIQLVQPYTEQVYYQPPHQYRSESSSPEGPVSPSQYLVPGANRGSSTQHCHPDNLSPEERFKPHQYISEMNYGVSESQQQPVRQVPFQPTLVGSVGIIPMPGSSGIPDIDAQQVQGRFLSTEDLISMYF